MRGREALIELRQAGYAPDWVFIDVDQEKDKLFHARDWTWMDRSTAILQTQKRDDRPDMRVVNGLRVFIQGENAERVFALRDACIAAKASRVIASHMRRMGSGEFAAFHTVKVTDTAGFMDYSDAEALEDV